MKHHAFNPGAIDKSTCTICKRNYIAHSPIAHCDACSSIGNCEIFGKIDDLRALLLCASCTEKEVRANSAILLHTEAKITEATIETKPRDSGFNHVFEKRADEQQLEVIDTQVSNVITKARAIDASVKYNGDFFNAQTVAIELIKQAVMNDESIPANERMFHFQDEITKRFEHLRNVIFEADETKHNAVVAQLAITSNLREFGNSLRESIRERIKANDANYQPIGVVKAPKLVKPKVAPMDRLIEAYALMHGITQDEARELIVKGK